MQENAPRSGFLEPAEVAVVLDHLPTYARPAAEFMALSGWRVGEVLRLTWGQVDFAGGVARHDQVRRGGNLDRAGVPRTVAKQLIGHKSDEIYERYNIVSERDHTDGVARYAAYPAASTPAEMAARTAIPLAAKSQF